MGEKGVEKGNGISYQTIEDITFQVEYDYHGHKSGEVVRKFTKITKITLDKWDLTEIVDHNLKESINNRIFNDINKDIYDK